MAIFEIALSFRVCDTGGSMKSPILLCMIVVLSCMPLVYGGDKEEAAKNYENALRQLKSGDLKVDFKALRMNCAYSGRLCEADSDDKKIIMSLLSEKKFDEALKEVNQDLDDDDVFVDIDLHFMSFIANTELGNKEKAEFHKALIGGLLDSIQENKRGRTEDDAFVVINVHEEYVFLRFNNMKVRKQSLIQKNGHSYDLIECTEVDDRKSIKVYFNIDIPINRLRAFIK
jgi:hypothetical protein